MESMNKETLEYLIHHVVLPPKLPQEDDLDASCERALLNTTTRSLHQFRDILSPDNPEAAEEVTSMLSTIDNLSRSRNDDGDVTQAQLVLLFRKMSEGTSLGAIPIEVKAQNAGIIVSRSDDHVVFEVFELAPDNESVMSTKGRLTRSFPTYASRIPVETFRQADLIVALSHTIATMGAQEVPEFQPEARKGGKQHVEIRDTTDPSLVTNLLINILTAIGSPMPTSRSISKNTREDVLWSDALYPWRRSPLWLLIRVAMQLQCHRSCNDSFTGTDLYKATMVNILSTVLDVARTHQRLVYLDLLHATSAKLNRRLRKLRTLLPEQLYNVCAEPARVSLLRAYDDMKEKWIALTTDAKDNIRLAPVRDLQAEKDLDISIPQLDQFIERIFDRKKHSTTSEFRPTVEHPQFQRDVLPSKFKTYGEDRFFTLAAVEKWVQDHLASWLERHIADDASCGRLRDLLDEYYDLAQPSYTSSDIPRSNSIMYLTIMELWVACDKSACQLYPLLKDFDPEVNTKPLQYILLPFKSHLRRLDKIERYVLGRRTRAVAGMRSVFLDFGHHSSFAVKYFDQSPYHQQLKASIEAQAAVGRQKKLQELKDKKQEYEDLIAQSNVLECEEREVTYDTCNGYTRLEHSPSCSKCSLQSRARQMGIYIHEWPLSPNVSQAKATVFELQIPEAFSHWRDATAFLMTNVLGFERHDELRPSGHYKLEDHTDMSKLSSISFQQRIKLLSNVKPLNGSHYNVKSGVSFLTEQEVCVDSALQYEYFDSAGDAFTKTLHATDKVQKKCTYELPARSATLQRYLETGSLSDGLAPNSVIASLTDCPSHFSLHEYKAFGTLPLGVNIIYSNILAQLAMPTVDLTKVETYCLIIQIIGKAGPPSNSDSIERIIHEILTDERFCDALLKEIETSIPRVAENWESWRALATFVQLVLRVYELTNSSGILSRCVGCLSKARKISLDWLLILKHRSSTSTDHAQRTELQSRATEIALLCVSTFDVDESRLNEMLSLHEAVTVLLQCSIAVRENQDSMSSEHTFLHRAMLQSWRSLLFRGFSKLQAGMLDGSLREEVNNAVSASWVKFQPTGDWQQGNSPHQQWFYMECGSLEVRINLLTAELLVNGLPLSRLPYEYTSHHIYAALFHQSSIEVVPTDEPGMSFSAKTLYRDLKLDFGMQESNMLVVSSHAGDKHDLVPSQAFVDILPSSFVEDYLHWYDHSGNQVEFRPRKDPWSSSANHWILKRVGSKWQLSKGRTFLVNPAGNTSCTISKIFAPLEYHRHIHVMFDEQISIELPRLQLSFRVDSGTSSISSPLYPDMVIDTDQRIHSLVGLSAKLVLKHKLGDEDRMVLIPQGLVTYTGTLDHVLVTIDPDTATKAHAYHVDLILGRLVDNGSLQSKLFLAYLHALTSYYLPDDLTSHTGTEAALTILRSAAVSSYELLTDKDIKMLRLIAELTPGRNYYPLHLKVMQQVYWDNHLSFTSQHPDFTLEVERLFDEARTRKFFYPQNVHHEHMQLPFVQPELLRRDITRSSVFRVDGFGAEHYTRKFDTKYQGRAVVSQRGEQSFIAAALLLRDQPALHTKVTASRLLSSLQNKHLNDAKVHGPTPSSPLTLRYGASWLGKPSSFLPKLWCSLHSLLSTSPHEYNKFQILMWLATAAFSRNADMDVIQALAACYRLPELASVDIPQFSTRDLSEGNASSLSVLKSTVGSTRCSFRSSPEYHLPRLTGETKSQWGYRRKSQLLPKQQQAVEEFANAIQSQWPCERPTKPTISTGNTYIDDRAAMTSIVSKFQTWYDNRNFNQYLSNFVRRLSDQPVTKVSVKQIQHILPLSHPGPHMESCTFTIDDIFALSPPMDSSSSVNENAECLPALPKMPDIPLKQHVLPQKDTQAKERLSLLCSDLDLHANSACEKNYVTYLRESCDSLADREASVRVPTDLLNGELSALLQGYASKWQDYLHVFNSVLNNVVLSGGDFTTRIGHCPRVSPTFWLRQLNKDRFNGLTGHWRMVIIRYGLAVTELHRAHRLLALSGFPQDLAEELRNQGHENWDPHDFPETLLLEAESGIMVRGVQEDIAKEMRSPPDGKNSVMQLNMGEGKSSVIVPIVAAALADGNTLVRVIVAKPQSKQMLQMLVSKLGGLLNRRIYHMPFSRALKLSTNDANTISEIYNGCMENRGILLVQPEHLLSFKLMGIECLISEHEGLGRSLLKTQQLFDNKSRDVIDESDENFSVDFELVYTMGTQRSVELSPERWSILHSLLSLVHRYAAEVKTALPCSIEFDDRWEHKGRCPRVRILRSDAEDMMLDRIAHHICKIGFTNLPVARQHESTQNSVYQYIREPELSLEQIEAVENGSFWTDTYKDPLLLVRGLIAGGVLRFALRSKRWRVNYGSDPNRMPKTNLAVPYRSKDSPSPRSEFSHPDVVIVLTALTYYYGGLNDEELFDTFAHLLKSDQRDVEYGLWVKSINAMPEAFSRLSGVNIKDRYQCITQVFPLLSYAKGTIDYFLSHIVFPKEMKEFPHKLSASGWDMGVVKPYPTTGFSGTNDSRHVLPLNVNHLDLPKQKHTNALVLAHVLEHERGVELLPPRGLGETSDAEQLLKIVNDMTPATRVILDVGAQILELNNHEVAETWLRMSDAQTTKAVVFFSDNEDLCVMDRNGRVELLQTSPFAKQLDGCLVYLDEAHTRGTDLKLPRTYRAAVTLGANLTKDRLVQACMRMRKLGKGQSVVFCISGEIQMKIAESKGKGKGNIEVTDVLAWVISETWADMRRSIPLWATQGRRFEDHKNLLNGVDTTQSQAEKFLEEEAQSIAYRYRPRVPTSFAASFDGWDMSNPNIALILERCQDFQTINFDSATLQEEQERELSPEIEEERQVQRPPSMKPEKHKLHLDVIALIQTGQQKPVGVSGAYIPAFRDLNDTSAAKYFDVQKFPTKVLVTRDFVRTVEQPAKSYVSDSYLRPVQWILSFKSTNESSRGLLIMSPFEVDQSLALIKNSKHATLHLYAPRPNLGYDPLDNLSLYYVGKGTFSPGTIDRSLIVQLNLFAGQLYFNSYTEYTELCDYLGLAWRTLEEGQTVQADGFVKPPMGKWGLQESPVKFFKELMKIRREGDGIEKTQVGRVLDGELLEPDDF
ncbi:hypothetical protein P280DRAFT_91529 [Massarina eburnea CBS 473.64]|uniref:ubiquitinyl hydrolase 1 n=1 Tax=Massarina eburnea CBS 473.64 TaxID=1395130 RepID=A0A6A6RTU5_9PLEO|nr:hypothetical protein P280DRAFT_91529 [Massarina eburnea CBS 473.64]